MAESVTHLAHATIDGATACGLGLSGASKRPRGAVVTDPATVTCDRCVRTAQAAGRCAFPAKTVMAYKTHYAGPFSPRRYLCGNDAGRGEYAAEGEDATCGVCRRMLAAGRERCPVPGGADLAAGRKDTTEDDGDG